MKKLDQIMQQIKALSFEDQVRLYGRICDHVEPHLDLNPKVVEAIEEEESRLGFGICAVKYPSKKSSKM